MKTSIRSGKRSSLVAFVLVFAIPVRAETPRVNGKLDRVGPFPVLRVWGTPEEMGFAHGYLLANEILEVIRPELPSNDPAVVAQWEQAFRNLRAVIEVPASLEKELVGMIKGIESKLGDRARLHPFDRPVELNDLVIHNAGDLLRAFGCSGFTAWGDTTGGHGVITARTFDYPMGGEPGVAAQMILVRQPSGGAHAVATVTFPGYIGAFTGISDVGVCTFMHDGTGGRNGNVSKPTTPVALTLTTVLERVEPSNAHKVAEDELKTRGAYPFSYMVRVVSPVVDGTPASPEWVFRVDPHGLSRQPTGTSTCVTTNHYLTDGMEAVEKAGDWTRLRYQRIESGLSSTIDPARAWGILGTVASSDQSFPTAHAIVVLPEQGQLLLGFATWDGRVIPATKSTPTTITFDELFKRPS